MLGGDASIDPRTGKLDTLRPSCILRGENTFDSAIGGISKSRARDHIDDLPFCRSGLRGQLAMKGCGHCAIPRAIFLKPVALVLLQEELGFNIRNTTDKLCAIVQCQLDLSLYHHFTSFITCLRLR